MARNLSSNVLFSFILTAANYIFPFLVFPYVSRVLGPANFGICNFVDSIVTWASLVSMMGVTILGVRTVAKHKDNKAELDRGFTSMLVLSLGFTLIATALLLCAAFAVPRLAYCRELLVLGLIKLWGNFLLLEWLYKGIEDFRYITLRTIAVKLIFVAAVYIFIRSESDYTIYFLLMVLSVGVNAAVNCIRATKLVSLKFDMASIKALFAPFMILGLYLLLNSMYTTFNVMYLGYVSTDIEVGYYSAATKIFKIVLSLYTAYSVVMLPHASSLISKGKHDEFHRLIRLSVHGLLLFAVPVLIFGMVYSEGIIELIAGHDYLPAVAPMVIVMPLIFIVGYEQILVMQILTPMASDRVILLNSITGASVGIFGNLLLVSKMASVGSAVVWLLSEMAVLVVAQVMVTRRTGLRFPAKELLVNLAAYLPYAAIALCICKFAPFSAIGQMLAGGVILPLYFMAVQIYVLHNPLYNNIIDSIKRILHIDS